MIDTGHWEVLCENINELPYGFIYEIINVTNNKKYIGKKQIYKTIKRKPLKNKKRTRISTGESDWKSYTGSSRELNEDIKRIGKNNFKFYILRWCFSKWELAYFEAKIQFDKEVLLKDEYYNGIINLRIGKKPKNAHL